MRRFSNADLFAVRTGFLKICPIVRESVRSLRERLDHVRERTVPGEEGYEALDVKIRAVEAISYSVGRAATSDYHLVAFLAQVELLLDSETAKGLEFAEVMRPLSDLLRNRDQTRIKDLEVELTTVRSVLSTSEQRLAAKTSLLERTQEEARETGRILEGRTLDLRKTRRFRNILLVATVVLGVTILAEIALVASVLIE